MKTFITAFPYILQTAMPANIIDLIDSRSFDGLRDSQRSGHGWSLITPDKRLLSVDGKYLLRYLSCERRADGRAVESLTERRIEEARESGREITKELEAAIEDQVYNEVIKFAAVAVTTVYLLVCPAQKLLIAGGGTVAKCEDALSYLRKTLDGLAVMPWGNAGLLSNAVTSYMTEADRDLPENMTLSTFGKTHFTGKDNSLKIVLDGIQNDTEDAKKILSGMTARIVEMSLVKRPDDGQIEYLANFNLHMPANGNIHFKKFDYDDETSHEDIEQELISEMFLVSKYTAEILSGLEDFSGLSDLADVTQD